MRKLFLGCTVLLFCQIKAYATGDSIRYLTPKDTIFLSIGELEEKIFEHKIEKKQTLFSLAQFYGLSVEELYYYNPGLKEKVIAVGQAIKVPIPNRAILRYKPKGYKPNKYASIYYVVKKGDTMFRISKLYFKMPADTITKRNKIWSETIKVGQLLHIGWISVDGVPADYHAAKGNPTDRKINALKKLYDSEKGNKKEKQQQGAAFWQKKSKQELDLYALHREATLNSIVQVTNPMSKVTVFVKVIGKIPDTVYGNEIVIVLSPFAAKTLDAKDERFFVQVKYY